ncbi:serine hydrolase [Bacillus sp. MRMR6]|uniref:serine hydrolase domain-containing protein n=1 Tax=Bacillus sp. MRMR6 TaxID=1928617 RepID=UPI00095284D9|nr:serine hydrolase domain-containing protein [Bacillus sp. MRMR6]OLS40013.1 serine hydrolase [Bacillus sp. MRMR6]
MKVEETKKSIENSLQKMIQSKANLKNVYLLVHSDRKNIHWNMAYGKTGDTPAIPDQPFHTASIGKSFTAILMAILMEKGLLRLEDSISLYLPNEVMDGLHIFKGKDSSNDILIEHLLAHRSGLPDFYEDKPKQGKAFLQMLLDEPAREWTVQDTIDYSKKFLRPRFYPGKGCHYTNLGYNLLGLIIEKVTLMDYHEALHQFIFEPLEMKNSYLSQYSAPLAKSSHPEATIVLAGREVQFDQFRSFKSIYAGGQTVSTSEDLLKFMRALYEERLIKKETLELLQQWSKRLIGIDLGLGLMRVRMLPLTKKYNAWGHLGSIGSFMLYNPELDVYMIGNFNNNAYVRQSIQFAFNTFRKLN